MPDTRLVAILWRKRVADNCYEVRSAGRTRRLYTNGVLHTEINPVRPVTGGVWDLLMLPAFFLPPGTVQRVLLLGVGGGALVHQLQQFVRPRTIVGVELDPVHLQVARRFFGAARAGVELHQADAAQWLAAYEGPRFDMIVDDLFGEDDGEPVRALAADARWFAAVTRQLARGGVFVTNFPSARELRGCAYCTNARVRRRFASAFELTTTHHANAVGTFLRGDADTRALRAALEAVPALDPRRKGTRLRYRVRRLCAKGRAALGECDPPG
jgi:predicted membrane-bound spermidine synthase